MEWGISSDCIAGGLAGWLLGYCGALGVLCYRLLVYWGRRGPTSWSHEGTFC